MSHSILARSAHGQFQLTFTIPWSEIDKEYQEVLKTASNEVEIPGFRKGKAPPEKVKLELNPEKWREQVLRKLLPSTYWREIEKHQLKPIMDPQLELLSMEEGKDWQLRAVSAEKPEVKLGEYKKKLVGLLKSTDIWTPSTKHDRAKAEHKTAPTSDTAKEDKKQSQAGKVSEWLLNNIEVEPPEALVKQQTDALLARLLDQTQKLGITLDQYMLSTHKKPADLRAEYSQRARLDLRLSLIIDAIGEDEKIEVKDEEIEQLIAETKEENIEAALRNTEQKSRLKKILWQQKVLDFLIKIAS
jgi:FKBP-type peptidyl-prolyl cis-trans isomerase (trigger factor)